MRKINVVLGSLFRTAPILHFVCQAGPFCVQRIFRRDVHWKYERMRRIRDHAERSQR